MSAISAPRGVFAVLVIFALHAGVAVASSRSMTQVAIALDPIPEDEVVFKQIPFGRPMDYDTQILPVPGDLAAGHVVNRESALHPLPFDFLQNDDEWLPSMMELIHDIATLDLSPSGADGGASDFFSAARYGIADDIANLLEMGMDPNAIDDDGNTALIVSSESGHGDVVTILLGADAQADATNDDGETALFAAASHGHDGLIPILLHADADPFLPSNAGIIPFTAAAGNGHIAPLGHLPNRTSDMEDALLIAAKNGHLDVVQHLIDRHVNLEARSDRDRGATAVVLAAMDGHARVMRALLDRGADVDGRDDAGSTALHMVGVSGDAEIARMLIIGGADVEARDKEGDTPLMVAARSGSAGVAGVLITAGADVNARSTGSMKTPLHYVILSQSPKLMDLLLINGADPRIKDIHGDKPEDLLANDPHAQVLPKAVKKALKSLLTRREASIIQNQDDHEDLQGSPIM